MEFVLRSSVSPAFTTPFLDASAFPYLGGGNVFARKGAGVTRRDELDLRGY